MQRADELRAALEPGLSPARRVLLDEACRLTERLDDLDATIRNPDTGATAHHDALVEARLSAAGLARLLEQLAPAVAAPAESDEPAKGGGLDELRRRRERNSAPAV